LEAQLDQVGDARHVLGEFRWTRADDRLVISKGSAHRSLLAPDSTPCVLILPRRRSIFVEGCMFVNPCGGADPTLRACRREGKPEPPGVQASRFSGLPFEA